MNEPILVTGAAGGDQGATGRHLVKLLRDRGLPVRAFVRRTDARSAVLESWGAEVVVGDFLDLASVRAAMRGVKRAYFAYPVQAGLLDATAIFAEAGRAAGLECLVEVGHLNNREDSPSPRTREQWLSERVFDWAGVGAVHLRAAVFFSNLRAFAREMIPGTGALRMLSWATGKSRLFLPAGDGTAVIPFVAGEDVARVAAAVLADPAPHVGKTYLVAGRPVSLRDTVAAFTQVLGRRVEYAEIGRERFRKILAKKAPDNPLVVEHLTVLWSDILAQRDRTELARIAEPVGGIDRLPDTVRRITGQPPKSLEEDIRDHAAAFGGLSDSGSGS